MALDMNTLLPDPAHRAKRQAMADAHFGTVHEGNFTGFTAAEEAGFATLTVATASDLTTELNNLAPGDRKVIECAWNGLSQSGARVFGITASQLSANSGVDWGYDRPACSVIVRPAAGFAPVFQSSYSDGVLELVGLNRMQFENMVFDATSLKFSATSTYPIYALVALKGCTFRSNDGSNGGKFTVSMNQVRTMHATGNQFRDCSAAFIGSPNYFRSWDNKFDGMSNNDVHGLRNYSNGVQSNWTAHVWVAGAIVYNMSGANPNSGLHCDFLQISHPNDSHVGYSVLAEMNVVHLDRGGSMAGTQGLFGDDGAGYAGDWMIHNNLVMASAYWACLPWDPTDGRDKIVARNMFLRAATPSSSQDAYPRIEGLRSGGVSGPGSLQVISNYGALFTTGKVSGETFAGNVVLDPRAGAAAPSRYVDILTGNGSFSSDANGYLTFASPDAGQPDAALAKAAIASFARPLSGWGIDAGPEDPMQWPSGDYYALASGSATPPTLSGSGLRINIQVL